jgi:hypothetical protein
MLHFFCVGPDSNDLTGSIPSGVCFNKESCSGVLQFLNTDAGEVEDCPAHCPSMSPSLLPSLTPSESSSKPSSSFPSLMPSESSKPSFRPSVPLPLTQAEILKALYDATNGDNWTNKWGTPTGVEDDSVICGGWHGITCINSKITQLNIRKYMEVLGTCGV